MIDKRELADLEAEYKELALADLTDDIDCSPSTLKTRDARMTEIETDVGSDLSESWASDVEVQAKQNGYASGAIYIG